MKKSINKLITIFLSIIFFILFFVGKAKIPSIEDLNIYIGAGYSMKKVEKDVMEYVIGTISNMYKGENNIESTHKVGRALTIGGTREDRQRKIGKSFFLGLSKLYLVDEQYAKNGIKSTLDVLFKNSIINDKASFAVCKGNSQDYYNLQQEGYENNAEYIDVMIKNSSIYNFFGRNYTLENAILSMDSEGKNIAAPYFVLYENGIKIDGMTIFKKDKLALILNMQEAEIMNMLREDKSKGILTIQKNSEKYIDYDAKAKRKVECTKVNDNYNFTIEIKLKGDVISNTLYEKMIGKMDVIEKFQEDIAKEVEKNCNEFISKMKNEYKIDCLQLGWVAAGKYGRDTGVDWDKVISKSDIKVKVKAKVDKLGRGEFQVEE